MPAHTGAHKPAHTHVQHTPHTWAKQQTNKQLSGSEIGPCFKQIKICIVQSLLINIKLYETRKKIRGTGELNVVQDMQKNM